ncbi:phosphatidate cytidylyltransferase, partial [Candidatus Pelagibacter communis]|uniref:phosphatidate cytidylyltransferase n=1 Tax=Pelagibacter ubique TaxID=198252 RepID=UPI000ADDCAB0
IVYTLIVLGVLSIIEFTNLMSKISKKIIFKCFSNIIFIIYIFLFSFFVFYFSSIFQLKILLFLILFTCIASDIGGFVVGKIFKGPRLTKISPKKTKSGSLGSILFSGVFFSIGIFYLTNTVNIKIILVGLLTSIVCQIGDLFFSFLKRKSNVKDTGNFFPGHGGVLDRLDGILLGLPFGFIFLILLF